MSAVLPPELSPRGGTSRVSDARGRRILGWIATVLASAVFVVSTGGWVLATYYGAKIPRILGITGVLSGNSDGPMTMLVVGSDSREGLTLAQARELGTGTAANTSSGQRSDTMMLVHLSADRNDITVVSLPRDSYVTIPAYTDDDGDEHPAQRNKLNAAFALGGAPLLIETVNAATGLEIDHYVEVGFGGVVKMVDALGGVDVCVPTAVDDYRSGLDLPAGTTHVDGIMGLAYVRARYIDPTADIGRMERQQRFIGSMFKEATSLGVLLDPVQLDSFLKAALSSVKLDEDMSQDMLLDLAADLAELSPKDIRFLTVPLSNVNLSTPVGSAVKWNQAQASDVFAALEADQPLVKKEKGPTVEVAPGEINVQALNGSDIEGLAGQASEDLATAGYIVSASPGNAGTSDVTSTVINYDPEWSESVKTLEAAFPDATLEETPGLGGTFQIVVGTEYVKPGTVKVAKNDSKLNSHTAADSICG
jgi:LCP family protein required for cell wall assembly